MVGTPLARCTADGNIRTKLDRPRILEDEVVTSDFHRTNAGWLWASG